MNSEFTSIIKLFEDQVASTPERNALSYKDSSLSYKQLDHYANEISKILKRTIGNNPHKKDVIIAIYLDRGEELVASMLGILKAGAAFYLIDTDYPSERIDYCLKALDVSIIIANNNSLIENPLLKTWEDKLIDITECSYQINDVQRDANDQPIVKPNDLAYAIFTSGTTGVPKGILIENKSLSNVMLYFKARLNLNETDVLLSVTSPSFDIFILEIFLPLISGAECILYDKGQLYDPIHLKEFMIDSKPTIMQATPSLWQLLDNIGLPNLKNMRVLCGGERLSSNLAKKLMSNFSQVFNLYGPSETTIWSMCALMDPSDKQVILGDPISNTQCYILNKDLQHVEINEVGELYIGGFGLARGYLNDKILNEQAFIRHPKLKQRLYKTGDLVKYSAQKSFEFIGRSDYQIKINGYRVELEEIENIVNKWSIIKEVFVTAVEVPNPHIILFCRLIDNSNEDEDILVRNLRENIRKVIPAYMCPSEIIILKSFPLMMNGKIDRQNLINIYNERQKQTVSSASSLRDKVMSIWKSILKTNNINLDDNFITLGGNSIHIPQIVSSLNKEFNVRLTIRAFMENQTVRKLSDKIDNLISQN